ncbi:unnamed protein product [Cercopithifilaria johnstoni]|uniref:Uncharacterized protein n=1 Tax=Cercopithifilaria johnstoni TaxID=2874296 RepID=A0A8J2LSF2_9BILA|nr:unnamed protein product [Cercopithifilaria johnstoni]
MRTAKKVRIVDGDIVQKEEQINLQEQINFNGHIKWILFAFALLLIVLAIIIVPVIVTIIQSYHHRSDENEFEVTTSGIEITKTKPTEIIVLTVSTAEGKKQKENETHGKLYRDKVLEIANEIVKRNDNPCATYVIEEFSDKATFSKLLSKAEVVGELEKTFNDVKSTGDISVTDAIESFCKIPWASQTANILFVPDEGMYRNQKIFKNDMKSAKNLLKRMTTGNRTGAPRVIIGDPTYFRNIDRTVSTYSPDMNVNELTNAILLALQAKEFTTPEGLFTSTISVNQDGTALPNGSETHFTRSWIKTDTQEKQISTLSIVNIDSTTSSSNQPVTVIKPMKCTLTGTFVSPSKHQN